MFDYWPADILDVHDGDTIYFRVDMGLDVDRRCWIRLKDVWCPELHEPGGPDAQVAVARMTAGKQWRIRTFKAGQEYKEKLSFIRFIGIVTTLDDSFSLNEWIVANGYGKVSRDNSGTSP